MTRWFHSLGLGVAVGLVTALAQAQDEAPATLKSLEERQIEITPSEPREAGLDEMRENYRELLKLTQDPSERNPILRRLADTELAIASQADDPREPARRALNIYQRLVSVQSYREREADLLYRAAHAADLAGDTAAGITALTRLIDNYPDFKLIPEAYFRRAETRFLNGSYRVAAEDYTWLIERGEDANFYIQALYKRGWSYYKLARHQDALSDELEVIRQLVGADGIAEDGTLAVGDISRARAEVAQDALRNMTLNFALLGAEYTPADFVDQQQAQPYEYLLTQRLVDYYLDKERYTDASETALAFARRNPEHPQAKALEVASIEALEAGGFDKPALEAKQAYVTRYGIDKQSWYGEDPLTVDEVRDRLQEYLDSITSSLHAGAQETELPVDYEAAAEWYARYLSIFPETPRAAELAFLRGEVLFEADRFADAATMYEQVAYDAAPNDKAAEAGYAAILAWREAAGDTAATDPQVLESTQRFAEQYPAEENAVNALARLAEDRYRAGELATADELAQRLIDHQPPPNSTQLANAWRIRAAAAQDAESYADAETALRWLLNNATPQEGENWEQQLATAIYKQGEVLVDAGEDEAAAEEFLRLRDLVPAGTAEDVRATALYDAAAAQIRAENTGAAISLLESFRSEYRNNELADDATRKLAELHLEDGNKLAAADEFARISQQTQLDSAQRLDAAMQTAQLSAEAGSTGAAITAYESLLRQHSPDFETTIEAQHALIDLHRDSGDTAAADDWRQRLIDAHAANPGAATERTRTLAARASLKLAGDKRAAFDSTRLSLPLEQSLPAKKDRLQAALDAYGRAADYGIAEVTTAATYHTGDLYYDFGQALLDSPRPSELSGNEKAQYEILLEEQAFPFEEDAIGIHEANVERIDDGIYDEWVRKSLAQLAELLPARYAKTERMSDGIVTVE